ncbi:MAG: NAD(P)H-hydrate epimerase, partial [Dehalococcoidales bacterium]|nr:NAD(P)H-hydrate epimerase [Dehalococcoidales bacterium]
MKVVTAEEMHQIDRTCHEHGIPTAVLMENAGRAVAEEVKALLARPDGQHIVCLVGGGNNGGDGLVACRYLHEWGAGVTAYLCAPRPADDENLRRLREMGAPCIEASADHGMKNLEALLERATCIIDALLGTGKARPLEGTFKLALEKASRAQKIRGAKIVAVDLPSGMDADTGAVDPATPRADLTVTLGMPKLGFFNFPGTERLGRLKIADIGIPEVFTEHITTELLTPEWARSVLPVRPLNANKGTFGRVLVVAGSSNYIGAAYLACTGALRAGAGLVTLATAASIQPILATKLTEVTYLPLPESPPGAI